MKVNELQTLTVTDLVLGGQALARHEGRVVFLDRGLPGDRVQARLTRMRRQYAEGRLESVLESTARRVPAACPHVARCGGCRFQDLDYAEQCAIKERQVRETLQHLGGVAHPRVLPIVPAPEPFHYRNKMEFGFRPEADGRPLLGLHERGSFDRLFALETCLIASPLTVEIARATARFAVERSWRAWHPRLHIGVARHLVVRHLPLTSQCAVHLVTASDELAGLEEWARMIAALSPEIRTTSTGVAKATSSGPPTGMLAGSNASRGENGLLGPPGEPWSTRQRQRRAQRPPPTTSPPKSWNNRMDPDRKTA